MAPLSPPQPSLIPAQTSFPHHGVTFTCHHFLCHLLSLLQSVIFGVGSSTGHGTEGGRKSLL